MLHVLDLDFNDHPDDFVPADPEDFEVWVTLRVGEGEAGSDYQVHVATPQALARIPDKRGLFTVAAWAGREALVAALEAFIARHLAQAPAADPYRRLGEAWLWEYARGR